MTPPILRLVKPEHKLFCSAFVITLDGPVTDTKNDISYREAANWVINLEQTIEQYYGHNCPMFTYLRGNQITHAFITKLRETDSAPTLVAEIIIEAVPND